MYLTVFKCCNGTKREIEKKEYMYVLCPTGQLTHSTDAADTV